MNQNDRTKIIEPKGSVELFRRRTFCLQSSMRLAAVLDPAALVTNGRFSGSQTANDSRIVLSRKLDIASLSLPIKIEPYRDRDKRKDAYKLYIYIYIHTYIYTYTHD